MVAGLLGAVGGVGAVALTSTRLFEDVVPAAALTGGAAVLAVGAMRELVRREIRRVHEESSDEVPIINTREEELRRILDAMVEGVFVTDATGKIVLTNQAMVRLAGEEVRQRSASEVIKNAALNEAVRLAAEDGEEVEVDFDLVLGLTKRHIAAQIAPLRGRDGVVAVLHDVTQLKRADSVRRDFVANASHELRTPLTAIRGFAETLNDGALDDPKAARRFVANILKNAERLHKLVEDLLELSRAESPHSEVGHTPVDVAPIALGVVDELSVKAEASGLTLDIDAPVEAFVFGDARAVEQVIINLVDKRHQVHARRRSDPRARPRPGATRGARGRRHPVRGSPRSISTGSSSASTASTKAARANKAGPASAWRSSAISSPAWEATSRSRAKRAKARRSTSASRPPRAPETTPPERAFAVRAGSLWNTGTSSRPGAGRWNAVCKRRVHAPYSPTHPVRQRPMSSRLRRIPRTGERRRGRGGCAAHRAHRLRRPHPIRAPVRERPGGGAPVSVRGGRRDRGERLAVG